MRNVCTGVYVCFPACTRSMGHSKGPSRWSVGTAACSHADLGYGT